MKTVVFTNGDGHDHVIHAVLQAPDTVSREDMQAMYQVFMDRFYPDRERVGGLTAQKWQENYDYFQEQHKILKKSGYKGSDETELFISWLCKNHGCVNIPYEEWY